MRTRLPLREIAHDPRRFATSAAGVAFAVFLMFIEMGFLNGVYDSQADLVGRLNADLLVIERLKEDFLPTRPFSRRRLEQARAVEGVAAAWPLYVEEYASAWRAEDDQGMNRLPVLAFDPAHPVFDIPGIHAQLDALSIPGTALIDEKSRDLFGDVIPGSHGELADRAVQIVGTYSLGPNFRSDGTLVMTDRSFHRIFVDPRTGLPDPDAVEIGLLKLAPAANREAVRARLAALLPGDVRVLTRDELVARIKGFWQTFQPIGAVFGLGAAVGFLIGVTVCYQVLFTDIVDRLPQYATLKAIGYFDGFLVRTVTEKALLLAVGGFVPGMLVAWSVYAFLENSTGIRMWMTPGRAAAVLALTAVMCLISGLLAGRRAIRADPAELF